MTIFDELAKHSNNEVQLAEFLKNHQQGLYDCLLTQQYSVLSSIKGTVEAYILNNLQLLKSLDMALPQNRVFITLLLDVSLRFAFLMPFEQLYKMLKRANCELSHRHNAAALFLIGIYNIDDYFKGIEGALNYLEAASEEDTEERIVETLIICYTQVVVNFKNQNFTKVVAFTNLLSSQIQTRELFFLQHPVLWQVMQLDISIPIEDIEQQIQTILDRLLSRKIIHKLQGFIIEGDTGYSQQLKNVTASFDAIRSIAVNECQPINNNSIFYSLNRGVAILESEPQLYSYLYSYGKMHYHKIYDALSIIPNDVFSKRALVYDWGCGQGIASLALLDYMNAISIERQINRVTLIEPSEIALRRAALHIKKLDGVTALATVHKDMDSLMGKDLINRHDEVKFHLFSNIIDVDYFSLTQLIDLIKDTFSGVNYFICASPYIDELKLNRIDSFCDAFTDHQDFEMLTRVNNKKGEWLQSWTRMIRVFKVNL